MRTFQYISNLSGSTILGIFIALIALLLLFIVIIFVKDVFFFTKEKELIKDKPRFYVKFLGVLFILSLSFLANNWIVYLISIVIIATLVTELQFLEMILALIWNRPDYIKGRFGELDKQQNEKEDQQKLNEISSIVQKFGEQLNIETATKNQYLLFYHFERVYRLIFGSQLKILLDAEKNGGRISLSSMIMYYRASGWNERGYDVGNYTVFLKNMEMLTYTTGKMPEDCFYELTPVGRAYLNYLRENNISFEKPF